MASFNSYQNQKLHVLIQEEWVEIHSPETLEKYLGARRNWEFLGDLQEGQVLKNTWSTSIP